MRRAVNGCNGPVTLKNIPVYYNWVSGEIYLGNLLNKDDWILENIESKENKEHYQAVKMMLVDWDLYENGWFVARHQDCCLFYYICQIHYHKPEALAYIQE